MAKDTKYTKQQYDFVCSMIWGSSPVDRNWAEGTNVFQTTAPKLLSKYPKLDISFHEDMNKLYDNGLPNTYGVLDTWHENKRVYKGTKEECVKYIQGMNVYQMNYSKLRLTHIRGDTS